MKTLLFSLIATMFLTLTIQQVNAQEEKPTVPDTTKKEPGKEMPSIPQPQPEQELPMPIPEAPKAPEAPKPETPKTPEVPEVPEQPVPPPPAPTPPPVPEGTNTGH